MDAPKFLGSVLSINFCNFSFAFLWSTAAIGSPLLLCAEERKIFPIYYYCIAIFESKFKFVYFSAIVGKLFLEEEWTTDLSLLSLSDA